MGDNLAQLLFETLQAAGPEMPPFRKVAWHELDLAERGAWEAVAIAARQELDRRFVRDMREAVAALGAEQAIANLFDPGGSGSCPAT